MTYFSSFNWNFIGILVPCDIERTIIDEGFVKKGEAERCWFREKRKDSQTSMMRNGEMVNHNTKKNLKNFSLSLVTFVVRVLKCHSKAFLNTFYSKMNANRASLPNHNEIEKHSRLFEDVFSAVKNRAYMGINLYKIKFHLVSERCIARVAKEERG